MSNLLFLKKWKSVIRDLEVILSTTYSGTGAWGKCTFHLNDEVLMNVMIVTQKKSYLNARFSSFGAVAGSHHPIDLTKLR